MRPFRFHVLGIPYARTSEDYNSCAFTQKVLQFCKMMHQRGHYIIHYGVEGSNPECDENVNVLDNALFEKYYYMNITGIQIYNTDLNNDAYQTFIHNTIQEVQKRLQPDDIILPFLGVTMRPITDALNNAIIVEPGIGHVNCCYAPYRAYESNAVRTLQNALNDTGLSPSFYDTVIPPFFDLKNFPNEPTNNPKKYFAFLGRIGDFKGVNIAIEVSRTLEIPLKIGGNLSPEYLDFKGPPGVEYIGPCTIEQRYELFHNAIAVFVPSRYMEPFGYTQIEALLSRTPIITTNWGAFPEVNKNGVTGYCCNTFEDFVNAAINCYNNNINRDICRLEGEKYSFDNIAPLYEKYFNDILTLYNTKTGGYTLDYKTQKKLKYLKERIHKNEI